jgi:hypothetical protein
LPRPSELQLILLAKLKEMPVARVEEWRIAEASDEERGTSARDAQPDGRTMGFVFVESANRGGPG